MSSGRSGGRRGMTKVRLDISMSLDGFVAGPDPTLEDPLGQGGEGLHQWAFKLAAWRGPHGLEGGEVNASSEVVEAGLASQGAVVMGRRMYSGGAGPWSDDPNAEGWWGDEPPFHVPVFVVTHHEREPLELNGGTTFHFVTDGVAAAVSRAREAAGDRDVLIAGGADVAQQALRDGLLDEVQVNVAPVFLGGGTRLFGDGAHGTVEPVRVVNTPDVTHLTYRVRA
jgi:dihydrofolate reductase